MTILGKEHLVNSEIYFYCTRDERYYHFTKCDNDDINLFIESLHGYGDYWMVLTTSCKDMYELAHVYYTNEDMSCYENWEQYPVMQHHIN